MVNIYIATSLKSLKRQNGIACVILENAENTSNTATIFGKIIEKTKNGADVASLKNALIRVKDRAKLTIFTDSTYLASAFEQNWLEKWQQNGWKTAKGEEIENRADWEEISELLNGVIPTFKVKEQHEYKLWMQSEIEKRLEKRK